MNAKKSLKGVVLGTGIAAIVGGLAYWSAQQPAQPERVYPPRGPGEVRPAPIEQRPQYGPANPAVKGTIGFTILANAQNDTLSDGIELEFDRPAQQDLAQYAPVHYVIRGVTMQPVQLYPENGMSRATTTFPQPLSLDGKVLQLYGTDRATRQQKTLFEMQLHVKPKSKYF